MKNYGKYSTEKENDMMFDVFYFFSSSYIWEVIYIFRSVYQKKIIGLKQE